MANSPVGRRLRISSMNSGSIATRWTTVQDVDTGENIDGVTRIVVVLDMNKGINEVEVTYFEVDDSNNIVVDDKYDPRMKTITVQNPELDDITAFEIMDNIRKERS